MKKLYFFLISLISLAVHSQAIDMSTMSEDVVINLCRSEGLKIGIKLEKSKLINSVDAECKKFVEFKANSKHKASLANGKLSITAGLNMIFITRKLKDKDGNLITIESVLSGPKSKLFDIESVTLSADGKWIGVIQSVPKGWDDDDFPEDRAINRNYNLEKEVRVFGAHLSGNVSPQYVLRHNELNDATDLVFHPGGQEIYVINGKGNRIDVYNKNTHYIRVSEKLQPKPIRKITPSGQTFREPASIDFIGSGTLLVLDKKENHVVALDAVTYSKQWELDKDAIGLSNIQDMKYDPEKKELNLFDEAGNKVSFQKD